MSNIKNIVVSNYLGDVSTKRFHAAGLGTTDPGYCIVTLNGHILTHGVDYTIQPGSFIQLVGSAPALNIPIVIYSFEEATTVLSVTDRDNISIISHASYVADGTTTIFRLAGPSISENDNCIVVLNGFIYQINNDFTVSGNIVTFVTPPATGTVVDLYSFSASAPKTIGGVSPKDNVRTVTLTTVIADGIKNTYTITGATSNHSAYCLVFIDDKMAESGVQYIISHNRVKFNTIPAAGKQLRFYAFGSIKPSIIPPSPYSRVRYLNKDANLNERTLFRNYWREQIAHYGVTVNFYVNLSTPENADRIYGESPLAGYSEPYLLNIAVKIDNETSMFSRFGLVSDTDSTCYIHHDDYQEVFGENSEPKAGDLIEFTEIGIDRLNYPKRGPRIMEIVQKDDEIPNEINNLAGHYVWVLKLKRFDFSKEASMIPELGTKDSISSGETVAGIDNPIELLSKKVFDYEKNACSNDRAYGDY